MCPQAPATNAFSLFFSYAHVDEPLRKELDKQLSLWERQGLISTWYDRDIGAGVEWAEEIDTRLEGADIILLLVSPDFMASDYCYGIEMVRAMERHEAKAALVIPVILRAVNWEEAPFGKLQALPTGAKAVTSWSNGDEAFKDVATGIRKAIEGLKAKRSTLLSSIAAPATRRTGSLASSAGLWNVPFQRNPFFTGREVILTYLHTMLSSERRAAITQTQTQAISGLGGVGKTQAAIEYAYRYRAEYQVVLWVRSNTREELMADMVASAELLQLPEKDAQDQSITVKAVKGWLESHTGWLLICDNADDLAMIRDYLPLGSKGHVLLTTRAQSMSGLAHKVEIAKMEREEGALLVLRRAGIIVQDATLASAAATDRSTASELVQELGGLPLALDQAGAYIEETRYSLSSYLTLYRTQRAKLLQWRGGRAFEHPEAVATTWSLSFEKVEKANPAASELLRLCAFLAPDAIPEEIITEGAEELGPVLQPVAADAFALNIAIRELLNYSLVERDPNIQQLSIHRLVQAVLKDDMDGQTQRQWAERTVKAVNSAFPGVEFEAWPRCERLLPQAQACAVLIGQWEFDFPAAARLLNQAGYYLHNRAQYSEALPLFQRALAIYEKALGPHHPDTATSLNNLAALYMKQGNYSEALPLFQRALAICEKMLGPDHPDTASSINSLAVLYDNQGNYSEALSLYQRALAIREKVLGPHHPNTATSLNNLAFLYSNQGNYSDALPLFQRALAICEKMLDPDHPNTSLSLNNLATLYAMQGNYSAALPLYQRALAIREKVLGPDHPDTASSLNNLAFLYRAQGNYSEALPLYQRALAICEKVLGPNHPDTTIVRKHYADLLEMMKREQQP